ncbi:MAG: hypothetical protein WAR79_02405 [Melioribacteraceae bacterium]
MNSNIKTLDPHFNLFASYSKGKLEKENLKHANSSYYDLLPDGKIEKDILEDNLTRAFLITLSALKNNQIEEFLNNLSKGTPKFHIKKNTEIVLDLQNLNNEKLKEKISDKNTEKVLLTITTSNIICIDDIIKELINTSVEKGSRPDGWIIFNNTTILIESKIKDNELDKKQLIRHLKKQFQLNNDEIKDKVFSLISVTWKEVNNCLFNVTVNYENEISKIYLKHFKELLIMTGLNLDLSFITEEKQGYERNKAKAQFPLLLQKLDEKVKGLGFPPDFEIAKRPKADYLWDFYGIKNDNEVKKDPHYSIYFDEDYAGIALTIKDLDKKELKLLLSNNFKLIIESILSNKNGIELSRYRIKLNNYPNIYRFGGNNKARRGPSFVTFNFELNLYELQKKINTKNFSEQYQFLIKTIKDLNRFAKQFEFGIYIEYPNSKNSRSDFYISNKSLFAKVNEENGLLELFSNFMKSTQSIFFDILNSKRKIK